MSNKHISTQKLYRGIFLSNFENRSWIASTTHSRTHSENIPYIEKREYSNTELFRR